ncbi:MAG: hypothetical protein NW215_10255 [Hyphomicrobiales bacterium]|nr:hypothetical protein [Hyphomicrobiales bacterium]
MRRYIITCDLHPTHQTYAAMSAEIKRLDPRCEQPHRGAWLIESNLSAREIRAALLPAADFSDRFFVCEAGPDTARFNSLERAGARNVIQFDARKRSAILNSVLHDGKRGSRLFKAAIGGSF